MAIKQEFDQSAVNHGHAVLALLMIDIQVFFQYLVSICLIRYNLKGIILGMKQV